MPRILTILDDYQDAARGSADWSAVAAHFHIDTVHEHLDTEALVARLARSEVVVAMRERSPFPAAVLDRLPALRLLITTGMKNASIDVPAAQARGITVCGTGNSGAETAELTMALILALTRNLATEDRRMREGLWQGTIGPRLEGKTLGLIGLGRQGQGAARLAAAFGMEVTAWSPHLTPERAEPFGVRAVSRDELFSASDIVSLHLPLADATRGLIGGDDLGRMKPTAYFVNTSRGPIVDEAALLAVLAARSIAGAALDVYDVEPLPVAHPFRGLTNVLLSPHLGYVTLDSYRTFYADAVEDVTAWLAGEPVRVL